jgi:predicted nucleic acid-binding protein
VRRDPPLHLIRRLAEVPPQHQFTTAITVGEMLYGAAKRGDPQLERRVREIILRAQVSGNLRHFARVPELRSENWLEG